MKRIITIILFYFLLILDSKSQPFVQNPSFEGNLGGLDATAPNWVKCRPSPDVLPGLFCIQTMPSHGNTFAGMACQGSNPFFSESIGQQLLDTLRKGNRYCFSIDIACMGFNCTGQIAPNQTRLELWGGVNSCGFDEQLWESPIIFPEDTVWKTFDVIIAPGNDYNHIRFRVNRLTNNLAGYLFIDNMTDFCIVTPQIWFTSPVFNSNQICSFDVAGKTDSIPTQIILEGKFSGSPSNAVFNLADTSWQKSLTYPPYFRGKDTIIATGIFPNGYIGKDTLIINIPGMAGFSVNGLCAEDSILFNDTSSTLLGNVIERKWYYGDGSSDIKTFNGLHKYLYQQPGIYNVSLKIITDLGCEDSISHSVVVQDCFLKDDIFIPNLITPNGDGKNDFFEIKILKEKTQVEIFNRWGERVYFNSNYKNEWEGKDTPEGIYFYSIFYQGKSFKGWIHLLK